MKRVLVLIACVVACRDSLGPRPAEPDADGRIAFAMVEGSMDFPLDQFTLHEARMEADTLILDIQFGGGCGKHEFLLVGNHRLLKSSTPQTDMVLAHDANGDACDAALSRTLRADVSPLRAAMRRLGMQHATVVINVAGTSVDYVF